MRRFLCLLIVSILSASLLVAGPVAIAGASSDGSLNAAAYGEYTWNFCAGGAWAYRSYCYAGSTVESNDGGSYQVVEGYRAAADPNYFAGIVQVSTSNGSQYRFGVELRGGAGYVKTNTSSFEEGNFTRQVGAAAC